MRRCACYVGQAAKLREKTDASRAEESARSLTANGTVAFSGDGLRQIVMIRARSASLQHNGQPRAT